MFLAVACQAVPRKRREAYVATMVKRAAPFPGPGWHTAWHGDHAMVWAWPQERLTDPETLAGIGATRPQRFLPETLLRGEPLTDAVELLRCSDGMEGRAWRDGALHASAWWPEVPAPEAWRTFCRGAGFAPQEAPTPQDPGWREQPWTSSSDAMLQNTLQQSQRWALPALLGLVVLFAAYQAGSLARLSLGQWSIKKQIAKDSARVSDILDLRNRAEDDLTRVHALLGLRPPVPELDLMARVGKLLDANHASITQWSMSDPHSLEVQVTMEKPDPRALVLAFQKTGLFDNVTADIGRGADNQLVIRAKVRPGGNAS